MMSKSLCLLISFYLLLVLPQAQAAEQSPDLSRFTFRINPLIIAIGGNLDLDVGVFPQWTIGPSFFGWGGCGNRTHEQKTQEGSECNTWVAYGLRSNYYFPKDTLVNGLYIGPGLYKIEKSFAYGHNGQSFSGKITGTAISTLIGYIYRVNTWFNLSGGIGGLYFLEKPKEVTVFSESTQTTISTGPSMQLLAELSLGFAF